MKLLTLVLSEEAFAALLQQPMAPAIAFRLNMLAKQIAPYLEQFKRQRFELAKEYSGKEDDIQLPDDIPVERRDEFVAKLQALLDEEVNISFTKLKPEDIEGKMTPIHLQLLEWLFDV